MKNKRNRFVWLSGFMLLLVLVIAGCSGDNTGGDEDGGDNSGDSEGGVTEVTLWHMEEPPQRVERFNQVIQQFNEEHDDIEVKPQVQSWDDAYSQFPAAIQAGNGPDLLFTLPDYTTLIQDLGVVQPMDEIYESLNEEHGFTESAITPYQYDDTTWALPIFGMVQALWYRADFLEEEGLEAPQTWEELTAAVQALDTEDRNGIALPASKSLATDQVLYTFMITAGAKDIIDGDNNINFNQPATVKAYEMYAELLEYSPNDSNTYTWGEPQAQFNSGNAAMAIEKGQYLAPFEEESGRPAEDLGVVPMPVAEGGEEGSIYYSNGIMMLTEDEQKQEAIKTFFDYLYTPENYAEFINAEPGLFLPVTESAMESDAYWSNEVVSQYEEEVRTLMDIAENGALFGFTDGVSSEVGQISGPNILADTLGQMISNGMSAEEAVEWGQQQMEAAIE
ncbi:ABC transporter substrate-binding protein [Salimicrobium halophilum]|uniref:Carbohydrate ABC transporter substrate-binding protein, CUT1 family n=1 Tax=Salimicrobium halophilum TaxID=86666 RepID=A0A1G8SBY8_9BACI|nr:extracellular solute-binding protein [Salimicrobium halophilum]SDJ26265.1 carbohydrate ABC transporter substrate-binding protein, CUT1 family [Salimicrobium halophilum]